MIEKTKITLHTEPFHYLEIRNLWTEEQRSKMFDEMLYLENDNAFLQPEETGSALDEAKPNIVLKRNSSVYMERVYNDKDRSCSAILKHKDRTFSILQTNGMEKSWFFFQRMLNVDSTLISYYEDADYYKPHFDNAITTSLSWFFKEPKKFNGGEITFTDYGITYEVTNDLTLIFPSNIRHEVSEVSINEEDKGKQCGRFCLAQLLALAPDMGKKT